MPKKPIRPRKQRKKLRAAVKRKAKKKAPKKRIVRKPKIPRRRPARKPVKKKAAVRHAPKKRAKTSSRLSKEQRREKYLTEKILTSIKEDTGPRLGWEGWGKYKSNFIKEWKEGDKALGRVVQYTLPFNPAPNPPPNSWGHITLSEGMGFGLRLAVSNHDQPTFDAMLRFIRQSCGRHGLMQWCIDQRSISECPDEWEGSASDGDIDIAYALCLAAQLVKQGIWNDNPHLDYEALAKQMIRSIRTHNLEEVPLGGQKKGLILHAGTRHKDAARHNFNPSHVAPVEMMMFKEFEPGYDWESVIHNSISVVLQAAHPKTGLVPEGYNPFDPSDPTQFGNTYSYEACRLPMRLAEYYDYLANKSAKNESLSDDQKADMEAIRVLLSKQLNFFAQSRHPDGGIYSGYTLGGTPQSQKGNEACFNGPVCLALAIMLKHKAIDSEHCSIGVRKLEELQLATQVIVMKSVTPVPEVGDSPDKTSPYYNSSLAGLVLSRMKEVQ